MNSKSETAKAFQLSEDDLAEVQAILKRFFAGQEVWVFGSRAMGKATPTSDLDLVVKTDSPIPLSRLSQARDAFSASRLPIEVDLLDWSQVNNDFRQVIEKTHRLFKSKSTS